MSQRRYRPALLQENIYGTNYPAPKERVIDVSKLNGGLNLWELDYRLDVNQSPDTVNMYWQDGSLSSRKGQTYVYDATAEGHSVETFCACYNREFKDYIIAQKGTTLYKINPTNGVHTSLLTGLTQKAGGTFFVFGSKLYYMNGADYIVIYVNNNDVIVAERVTGYIPVTVINRTPAGTGGSLYQPENRLSAGKEVWFTQDATTPSTTFALPYTDLDATPAMTAVVNGTTMTEGSGFTVNRTTGVVTFSTAPSQTTQVTLNNVKIKCYKRDVDAENSILKCTSVTVYGGDNAIAVVCGGTPAQPNAYFWTGNDSTGVRADYFPYDYYNLAGNADEYITGFGKQQSMLVIFKERSMFKTSFSSQTIDERVYMSLPSVPVNDSIGCDLEGSIRLVQNNLVFANTYSGVYVLLDTTAYGENTVKRLSRNVNGDGSSKGLLADLRVAASTAVTAYDDNQRYWLCANGHAYLWDYTIAGYGNNEAKLSWFYLENINARGWYADIDDAYYFTNNGSLSKFISEFVDYGAGFKRKYVFATQFFDTYEVLKDVLKVIFAVRSDTNTKISITYNTDYESRRDLTDIMAYSHKLSPRNTTFRSLRTIRYASVHVRKPRCFHVRHFSMTLENSDIYTDMSVISAQIFYRYNREDR